MTKGASFDDKIPTDGLNLNRKVFSPGSSSVYHHNVYPPYSFSFWPALPVALTQKLNQCYAKIKPESDKWIHTFEALDAESQRSSDLWHCSSVLQPLTGYLSLLALTTWQGLFPLSQMALMFTVLCYGPLFNSCSVQQQSQQWWYPRPCQGGTECHLLPT